MSYLWWRVRTPATWRASWLAGLTLIAVGILCLLLSGAVARTGSWWQGTWQALGVGFVVGGIVDVLAISAMSQYASASRRRWNDEASRIVSLARSDPASYPLVSAYMLLKEHGDELDTELRAQLREIAGPLLHTTED